MGSWYVVMVKITTKLPMNIDYIKLSKDKRLFNAVFGISQVRYEELIKQFSENYSEIREKEALKKKRKRSIGGGRKPTIFWKPSKLLFFTLFFLRVYPTNIIPFLRQISCCILLYLLSH